MKKRGIIQYVTATVMVVLGVYIVAGGGVRILREQKEQAFYAVERHAQKQLLTGLVYQEEQTTQSVGEWIAQSAMHILPLGAYVQDRSQTLASADEETYEMLLKKEAEEEHVEEEAASQSGEEVKQEPVQQVDASLEKLKDFEYLVKHFYTVDSTTMTSAQELDAQVLLEKSMKINTEKKGPKILIYHTHSQETFADSVAGDDTQTIVGIGDYLAQLLNETYGIETIHDRGVYDVINGKLDRSEAYELSGAAATKIMKEHPTIEVVIDLHRDGVGENTRLVTDINGKPTAQIMFFNGLCRTKVNGDIKYFSNPYIQDNLAFSLQMKLAAEEAYPGFTRRIYLKGYRYNMQLAPKMLLIEAGAQTNTIEEMKNAMEPLAETLHRVLTK